MITAHNIVNAPIEKVWEIWTTPKHIQEWNNASPDWHTPYAENDIRVGGKFKFTMAAKDESMSFDFVGVYTNVEVFAIIEYKLTDGRTGSIYFENNGSKVKITETFEPETENSESMQQQWCQAVIDNFKIYIENIQNQVKNRKTN
jgi:uncharacterized protein YndB with AHSA1/START domain